MPGLFKQIEQNKANGLYGDIPLPDLEPRSKTETVVPKPSSASNPSAPFGNLAKPSLPTNSLAKPGTTSLPKPKVQSSLVTESTASATSPKKPGLFDKASVSVESLKAVEVDTETFEQGTEGFTQEELQTYRSAVDYLKENLDNPVQLEGAMKNMMLSLTENPNLESEILPEDVNLLTSSMRKHYGVTVQKAESRKAKKKNTNMFSDIDLGTGI